MFSIVPILVLAISVSLTNSLPEAKKNNGSSAPLVWTRDTFKTAVYFGDSYTDEGRGMQFLSTGKAVPAGYKEGNSLMSKMKTQWPGYVRKYAPGTHTHNYAMSGGMCSRKVIDPKKIKLPTIREDGIPNLLVDMAFKKPDGTSFLNDIDPATTVWAIWDGTNDLGGMGGFMANAQLPGKTPMDFVECIFSAFEDIYKSGGRKFVLLNIIPLNLLPTYTLPKGKGADQFYPGKPSGEAALKAANEKLREMVISINTSFSKKVSYEAAKRYPGASMVLFDTYKLFTEIYNNPKQYLNGTEPPNVTGIPKTCFIGCKSTDSYLWGDALHPSEATMRIVGNEFVKVVSGESKYAMYPK